MNWKALPMLLMLIACDEKRAVPTGREEANGGRQFPIVNIGACEYIISYNSYGNLYSHKGDCNNPMHKTICDTLVIHDTLYLERTVEGLKMH